VLLAFFYFSKKSHVERKKSFLKIKIKKKYFFLFLFLF